MSETNYEPKSTNKSKVKAKKIANTNAKIKEKAKTKTAKRSDRELLSFLWSYIRPYKKEYIQVSALLLLNVAFATLAPIFFRNALDILDNLEIVRSISIILPSLIIYLILMIAKWFAEVFRNVFRVQLNSKVTKDLREDIFQSILDNKMGFFDHNESGVLTSRITNDIAELSETSQRFVELLTMFVRLIVIVGIFLSYSPVLTFVSIVFLPFFFLFSVLIRKYMRHAEKTWRKNFANVNQRFSETMRSIAISKAFAREEENIRNFTQLNEQTYKSSIKRGLAIFLMGPIGDFFRHVLLIIILLVGTMQNEAGNLSVATFYFFIFLLDYYYYPVMGLARNYSRFQALFANLEKILEITSNIEVKEINNASVPISELRGDIKFEHVNFAYTEEKQILQDISFHVKSGQRVALVGNTGSGKTTIASLLMRFYDIQEGQILIDDHPIQDYDISSLRNAIGLVSQRVLLFKGTIRENLLLAYPEATDDHLWSALDAVQAREFIELLPDGLDSKVSDGGNNLSAGQRQMITFARVLLGNPQMIILDEATSAVDLYTESKIQDSTDLLLKGRTSIVIAHRLTTILKSDLIIVLEDGMLRQFGTHNELMAVDGPYQEMYQLYFKTQSAKYLENIKTAAS
ncbi:Vitamin B12 import ATP-binding protein BtuD [Candidatus Lokiarchaeum ossiferum]|uniref:Vitamin B12 import ATP-binding protein BtuD n=1 Tax=Candidatus Lokiarchaeum ossiferum TaxID=2951803 RepID=A0ABY6HZ32_9ARCH|nr:Vitamin B12 import ATP-binding protein BtuD [Candidatus Lokiarchaeum sp. B-35]